MMRRHLQLSCHHPLLHRLVGLLLVSLAGTGGLDITLAGGSLSTLIHCRGSSALLKPRYSRCFWTGSLQEQECGPLKASGNQFTDQPSSTHCTSDFGIQEQWERHEPFLSLQECQRQQLPLPERKGRSVGSSKSILRLRGGSRTSGRRRPTNKVDAASSQKASSKKRKLMERKCQLWPFFVIVLFDC